MAGVIHGVALGQLLAGGPQQFLAPGVRRVQLKEVEPAEHRVRPPAQLGLRRPEDVHDAAVAAAGEQHRLAPLLHQQVLLVAERVTPEALRRLFLQFFHNGGPGERIGDVPQKGQLLVQPQARRRGHHPALQLPDVLLQADVPGVLAGHHGVKIAEGVRVRQHVRLAVDLAEGPQAAAVVGVAVGQHRHIHRRQVHAQLFRVFNKGPVRAHVK